MIRQNQRKLNAVFIFTDIAIIALCVYISSVLVNFFSVEFEVSIILRITEISYGADFFAYIFVLVCVHIFFYRKFDFYKSHRSSRFLFELKKISTACFTAFVLTQIVAVLFFRKDFLYEFTAIFSVINLVFLAVYKYFIRKFLRYFRSKGYNLKYLVIVGKNQCTENFIKKIEQKNEFGYKIVGIFGDKSFENIQFLGEMDALDEYMANTLIDEIIITVEDKPELLKQIVDKCNYHGVKFTILLDIFSIFNDKFYIYEFDNLLSVSTYNVPLENSFNYMLKRSFDIIASVLSLIVLSPLMITVAVIIKATSKGGAIYKQVRMGLNRKEFNMYKFRSMKIGQEKDEEFKMAEKDDDRCTKIGRFIRKFGIDELPQIFNVLKGDMSLVGPRPELPYHVGHFKNEIPLYMVKHYVKPGISGWAQVNGLRGNTSIEERIKYDIYYIENWSLWFDIKIIFLTFIKGVFSENAY